MYLDHKDELFCEIGSDLGYLTPDAIAQALEKQRLERSNGIVKPIGAYFFAAQVVTKEQVGQILKLQTKYENGPSTPLSTPDKAEQQALLQKNINNSCMVGSDDSFIDADLSTTNILWMVFLTIITSGIYLPFWFLMQANGFNQLSSKEKIETKPLYISVVAMIAINVIAALYLNISGAVIIACALGILYQQSAKVRKILMEHFNPTGHGDFIISENAGILPLFFNTKSTN